MTELPVGLNVEHTMAEALGFELLELGEERARGRFVVQERVQQPMGIVHGGAYAALGETIVSAATYLAVVGDGQIAVGQSNHTSFLRPISKVFVNAEATRRHRGRTSWVWEIDFTDDKGRLCAITRVTMAVRPAPDGAPAPS